MGRRIDEIAAWFEGRGRVAVAYSGGSDSTLLLLAAYRALGDEVLAVSLTGPLWPHSERALVEEFIRRIGCRHRWLEFDPLGDSAFIENPKDRCYFCKRAMFTQILDLARSEGINLVVEGSNADDAADYRPGTRALRELGIVSPLQELGVTKQEVIGVLEAEGLGRWVRPPAGCLATRIPHGVAVTRDRLARVEAAEGVLENAGFKGARVRDHWPVARLEVGSEELARILEGDLRERVSRAIESLGFVYVAVDLRGYVRGSLERAHPRSAAVEEKRDGKA